MGKFYNAVNLIETIDEHEKCKRSFAYFCYRYCEYPGKEEVCSRCKHREECKNQEWEDLKDYEPLEYN